MKSWLLLLILICSCQENKVDEIRVKQICIEYYKKGLDNYTAGSFDSLIYNLDLSLKYISTTDTLLHEQILSMRSHAYIKLNRQDSAIHDLEQLVKMHPANLNYLIDLSYLYGETKRFTKCLSTFKKIISIDQSNPFIYNGLAYYSAEAGVYDTAIRYAEEGLKLTPDSALIGALLNNLEFAQSGSVSQGQNKMCQNLITPELEDEPVNAKQNSRGSLRLAFENGFLDSAVVRINNKIISRILLKTSKSTGRCPEYVIIDYSHYKELPRITIELINEGECMHFYPVRNKKIAYINHDIVNKWDVVLSNDERFYF